MKRPRIAVCLLAIAAIGSGIAAHAEDACEPSRWGADDEIGNANLISAESVLAASKLIRTGKTYSLGIVIDSTTPAFAPRGLMLQVVQPNQQEGRVAFPNASYNDDVFQGWFGIGPQIDGLGHLGGPGGMYYNCNDAKEFAFLTGLTKLGIEKIPPIVARGVVLDMAGHFGVPHMESGQFFTVEDVQAVEEKQGTPVQKGDVVLFHTGWTDAKLNAEPDVWVATQPGQSEAGGAVPGLEGCRGGGRRHLGPGRGAAARPESAVPGTRDPAAGERHLHPRDDEHRDRWCVTGRSSSCSCSVRPRCGAPCR